MESKEQDGAGGGGGGLITRNAQDKGDEKNSPERNFLWELAPQELTQGNQGQLETLHEEHKAEDEENKAHEDQPGIVNPLLKDHQPKENQVERNGDHSPKLIIDLGEDVVNQGELGTTAQSDARPRVTVGHAPPHVGSLVFWINLQKGVSHTRGKFPGV